MKQETNKNSDIKNNDINNTYNTNDININNRPDNRIRFGTILVCMAGICWGIIGLFTRRLSTYGLNSVQITMIRNLFSSIEMFIIIVFLGVKKLKFYIKDIWIFIGTGIISIALFNICYFKTLELTTMNIASILLYTAPVMVMVMSVVFFKEKITKAKILSLFLAFTGCIFTTGLIGSVISGSSSVITMAGIITGVLSGFFYALYSIFAKVALKKYDVFTVTFYTFFFAAVSLFFVVKPVETYKLVIGDINIVLTALLLATISTVTPFICYTLGLKYLEPGHASVMAFIEPMVATLCGIFIYKESFTIENIFGIIFIFISIVLLNIKPRSLKN